MLMHDGMHFELVKCTGNPEYAEAYIPLTVSPTQGRPANAGMEILVQGRQPKGLVEYLMGKRIGKEWIQMLG